MLVSLHALIAVAGVNAEIHLSVCVHRLENADFATNVSQLDVCKKGGGQESTSDRLENSI